MARRASAKQHPLAWGLIATVLVAVVGGGLWFSQEVGDPYRTTPILEPGAYLENALSLRGNTYKIQAEVQNSLAWTPAKGRLISVVVQDTGEVLPMLVPPSLNHINLQKGQRFYFKFEVVENGVLLVKELTKS